MPTFRVAALAAALVLSMFVIAADPAAAQDFGCGADTVEVCMPVCVTEPCPQYVCVHGPEGQDVCVVSGNDEPDA